MAYPSSLDELTDGVPSDGAAPTTALDNATYPHDDHHRALGVAVEAIEAELGTNPKGGSADVKTRIAATETVANAAAAKASNLSDLTSASSARTNLGLGGAATLAVGTTAGTVAAGDDSRITGAVPKSTVTTAGDLIYGTGNAAVSRLGLGSAGRALAAGASAPTWVDPLIRTRSTYWHENFVLNTPSGTAWPIINRAYFAPWWLPSGTVLTAIALNVTSGGTAGNVVRLAVYSNSSFRPATVLAQGTVAGDSTGVKTLTFASPITVTGGWFWVAGCPQGSTSPGSTWLSSIQIVGQKIIPTEENGAAWAANYVGSSGAAWYQTLSGDFADSPSLVVEAQARCPYLALRVQ